MDSQVSAAYLRRCHKALKEMGAPLENWYCVMVIDTGDDSFECELCGCKKVRYVHVMCHDDYNGQIRTGCICAGVMEGDILAAKERDEAAKRKTMRKSHYLKKEWDAVNSDCWRLKYKSRRISITRERFRGHDFFIIDIGGEVYHWKDNRHMGSFLTAQHYIFEIIDGEENPCKKKQLNANLLKPLETWEA
jgi:hypothetical protein